MLGAILLDNQCFNQAAAVIAEEDFSLDTHRRIYRAMAELLERGARVDYVTLTEQLGADGVKLCGGAAYVTSLTDGLPRVRNIRNYAQIVREKAQSRLLIHMCGSAQSAVRTGSKPETVLAEVQQRIIDIFHKGRGSRTPELPELARQSLEQVHLVRSMPDRCVGFTTGIPALDEITTGFRNGEFYVVGAARPTARRRLPARLFAPTALPG